jgi:PAS domain S-box-containing protein
MKQSAVSRPPDARTGLLRPRRNRRGRSPSSQGALSPAHIQAHLAAIVEFSDDAIISKDLSGTIMTWNAGAERIFGYASDEAVGRPIAMLIPPDRHDEEREILSRIARGLRVDHYETVRVRKDGGRIAVSLSVSPLYDERGTVIGASKIARDITEKQRAEELLRTSLREKDVLLKEVHHRVKNNLQVISSLLSLQAGVIKDPEALKVFQDSQSRVKAMALIHDRLYQSGNLAEINMQNYLQGLIRDIEASHIVRSEIRIEHRAGEVALPVDAAIPCALIAHELIVNSLEHAFGEANAGTICVRLYSPDPGACVLAVSDTGRGLPEQFDVQKVSSLGLSLVAALVQQLRGTLAVTSQAGATFTVTFPFSMESSEMIGIGRQAGGFPQ